MRRFRYHARAHASVPSRFVPFWCCLRQIGAKKYLLGPGAWQVPRGTRRTQLAALQVPSDGDVFSRADVGSGDSTDHKTTARSTKLRPGQPHIPTRHGGYGATAPGWPGPAVGLRAARAQICRLGTRFACQNMSRRRFRWDAEVLTPITGHHRTLWDPPGPWAPTWVGRAPIPAAVAVQNRK